MKIIPFLKENKTVNLATVIFFSILVVLWGVYLFAGHSFVEAIYQERAGPFFNCLIEGQGRNPLDHYLQRADIVLACISVIVILIFFLLKNKKIELNLWVASFFGVLLILISTSRNGIGLDDVDSSYYLSAARNLLAGKGYMSFTEVPFTSWPPLMPTLLAFFGLIGVDLLSGARFLNAIAFGGIIYTAGQLLKEDVKSHKIISIGLIWVVLSIPLFKNAVFIESEILFIFLANLFFLSLRSFLEKESLSSLFLVSSFCALACLQRYIGISLILIGSGSIAFLSTKKIYVRVKEMLIFSFLSFSPICLWMLRNYMITHKFTGAERTEPHFSLIEGLFHSTSIVTAWFLPEAIPFTTRVIILGLGCFALIAIAFYASDSARRSYRFVWPMGMFLGIYTGLMIFFTAMAVSHVPVFERWWTPVYIPLIFFICCGMNSCLNFWKENSQRHFNIEKAIVVFSVFLMIYPSLFSANKVASYLLSGISAFNEKIWQDSETIKWLRVNSLEGRLYSNGPQIISMLADKNSRWVPRIQESLVKNSKDTLTEFYESLQQVRNNAYIVWFTNLNSKDFQPLKKLESRVTLKKYLTFSDGDIYEVAYKK